MGVMSVTYRYGFAWFLLVLYAAVPGVAGAQPADTLGTVSTQATATRRLPNTQAEVSVAVSVSGPDVPAVSAAVAQRAKALLTYLQAQKAGRLHSDDLSIQPETQPVPGKPDRVTGYSGHAGISFITTPDAVSALIAGSLDNGANALGSIHFSPRPEEIQAARQDLATEATKTALAEARVVAEAAGQHVVRVQSISVGGPQPLPMMRAFAPSPAMQGAAPMPADAGDSAISVSVSVQVKIDG